MSKSTLFLLALLFVSNTVFSQGTWQEMIQDPSVNFFDVQQAFNDDLGNVPYKKGLGIKQYRRWEYYWENRVDERGFYPEPGHVLNEMTDYYNTHTDSRNYLFGSGNWSLLGPIAKPANGTGQPNGNGRLTAIAFHPTDANTIYAGAPAGGFWKSTDAGASWTQYITGFVRLGVNSIVVDPATPNTIYIGTGDRDGGDSPGYGVWRSIDGGLTWSARNTGMGNRTVYEVLMDPTNSNILIASTNGNRVYRSINGGANWTFTGSTSSCKDLAFHPTNSNIVYASGTSFNLSIDNGQSFSQISAGIPTGVNRMALGVSADEPNWVYVFAGGNTGTGSFEGIYRSTDSGVNFSTRTTTPNIMGYSTTGNDNRDQAWYDMTLAVDPTDANILFTGAINIWKSIDGGSTMTLSAHWTGSGGVDDVHADHHVLEYSPLNNNLYNGNDGGIYFTSDGGTAWNEISSGLYIAQLYKLGVSQQTFDKVINGYQDNGTSINVGTTFTTEIGGDGMECIIDPTDDTYMYGALYYGSIRCSRNGGTSFSTIAANGTNGINEDGGWVTPYKLDPNNAARMFAGYDNVWRTDDVKTPATNAIAWTQISSFTGTSNMTDLANAPSNSDVMYVSRARNGERFFRSNNATGGGPTWTNLSGSLPVNSTPKDIEIDPIDPTHLFIALGNDIYESTNSGAAWSNFSGTLPNLSLNTIIIDKDSPLEAMYVGMDVGVYYRDNTMGDWVLYSTGIPNVEVRELEIHYNTAACKSTLYAATYGLGLWKSDLKDPGTVASIACFEASSVSICMGEVITFTDNSSYTPTSWTWNITPATVTFTGGTNVNSQNPQVIFNTGGTYTVELTCTNATGADTETKNSYITVSTATVASSFNDDFEGHALCGIATDCGTTLCPLSGTLWTNLTNGTDDGIDWRVDDGGTASQNTGPTAVDFNPGTATGNYAYLESSGGCNGQTAILESTCMTLDQDYDFVFGYHMLGGNIGSLHLDINVAGVWTLDLMTAIVGDQGASWLISTTDLTAYTGQTVKIRIRGITGNGFESDIAIDDIRLNAAILLSTQLTSFTSKCTGDGSNLVEWFMSDNEFKGEFQLEKHFQEEWKVIGSVSSDNQNNYQFPDNNPLLGENLYRLAMIENNGDKKYSTISAANCNIDIYSFVVFPNPFKEGVSLQFHSKMEASLPFRITNLLGQTLIKNNLKCQKGLNTFSLPMDNLPQGVYLLHAEGKMIKLIKQ
jgi:PKD repeat protein